MVDIKFLDTLFQYFLTHTIIRNRTYLFKYVSIKYTYFDFPTQGVTDLVGITNLKIFLHN